MMAAGWVAMALAVACVASAASIALFFAVGGPFGLINDVGNALIGLLSATLAILLIGQAGGWPGVVAAVLGAAITVWGSWLVMSSTTGFVLAGFVSTVGFGLIGVWLALVAWSPMAEDWSDVLRVVARVGAGALVIGGLVAVPAALARIDSYDAMPGWMWLFSIGWLGVYALLPIAAFSLGQRLLGS